MFESNIIKDELIRIAFFLQHSSLLDRFSTRTRKALLKLPVEWIRVDPPEYDEDWKEADAIGRLKIVSEEKEAGEVKPDKNIIKIKVIRDEDRNEYQIFYQGKLYKTNNLSKLQNTVVSLATGEKPKPQIMQEYYDNLSSYKTDILKYAEMHFLAPIVKDWYLDIKRDVGHIYVRFYVLTEDVERIEDRLKDHSFYRIESIVHYLRTIAKKYGLDIKALEFKYKFIKVEGQAGFIISIK